MKTRWIDRSIWVTTALLSALLVGCGESRLTSSTDGSYSTSGSSTYTVSEMRSLPAAGVQVGFIPNQLRCDIGDPGDQIRGYALRRDRQSLTANELQTSVDDGPASDEATADRRKQKEGRS